MVTTEKADPQWNKLLRNWARTRLAHEGMMLEKIQRQNRIVEQLAAQTRDGKFSGGPVSSVPEDDDMGVSIGNEIHNHYEGGSKPSGATGWLGKAATGVALVAAIVAGAGLLNLLAPDPPASPPAAVDTDTQYQLQLGP